MKILDDAGRSSLAAELKALFRSLWPLHRSLAGEGYVQSLDLLESWMPMDRREIPSDTKVYDWIVPNEWGVREAYFRGPDGVRRADVKVNNLHVLGYSQAFRGTVTLEELRPHLHTRPDLPQAIPYITSYYGEQWGFCLSHKEFEELPNGDYDVVIDSFHRPGNVVVGESVLPGISEQELLFTSYLCHPSMANNELSGPLALVCLFRLLREKWVGRLPFTVKFALHPETIGALSYLWLRKDEICDRVMGGSVLSCVGLRHPLHLKRARKSLGDFERAMAICVRERGGEVEPFSPFGSDERQYCSPGFDLPICLTTRGGFQFPEYHTSLDDETALSFEQLVHTAETFFEAIWILSRNRFFKNAVMFGEPFLSRWGLYPTISTGNSIGLGLNELQEAYIWILSMADGTRDLLAIIEGSGLKGAVVIAATENLEKAGLLKPV